MRHFLSKSVFSMGVLFLACGAWAQYGPNRGGPYRNDPYYRGGGGIVDRVIMDLDRARSYRRVDGHERRHFEQARYDLERFQANWANGRFDRGRLDSAISNINHLVSGDQVGPRDRQILSRDLYELRQFRANRGGYGRDPYRY